MVWLIAFSAIGALMLWESFPIPKDGRVLSSIGFIFLGISAFLNTIPFNKPVSTDGSPISSKYQKLSLITSVTAIALIFLGEIIKFAMQF
ncbi:hypothetical protein ACUHMQ_16180 [Chitinimonas sp. PSY-7]|uniref:hypothetical protein n=1 Tax=Chitinimonas sp. PSY-7 TaxID=3459088 RepID=UPI00403FD2D1